MFKLGTPPNNTDATSFAFKRWFQDIYTWSKGGVLVPNGGYLPDISGVVSLGKRNIITNGNFEIWQRGTTIANAAASAVTYTTDRWAISRTTAGTQQVSQQTAGGPMGHPNYARISRTPGDTTTNELFLAQATESIDSWKYAGQKVTLSFWLRCGSGFSGTTFSGGNGRGTFEIHVNSGTGTDQGPFAALTGNVSVINQYIVPTTTWTFYKVTGTVPTNCNQFKTYFGWIPPAIAGANNYVDIAGVQLEVGTEATAFETISFEENLYRCGRYFQKSQPYGTAPSAGTGNNSGAARWNLTTAGAVATHGAMVEFSPRMRVPPNISFYNPSVVNAFARNSNTGTDATATSVGVNGENNFSAIVTGLAGWAVGNFVLVHWSADAEL